MRIKRSNTPETSTVRGKGSSLRSQQSTEREGVLMLPATIMRRLEALTTISKQGKRLNGLFRLMEAPVLWHEAYANIYANEGAITKGIDEVTLDGFSQERVRAIITRLKSGTYRFQPTRRTYIPKKSGKKRPLGISSGDDKLVQEVVRIILERIYEPTFEESSHGFRPERSPHTALQYLDQQGDAVKGWVDMDIRDYFTTIDHDLLMTLLQKKIEDKRFLRLIQAMLKAGYLEDWQFHTTYSGVPQGSICAPILANVYLHELDCFMKTVQERFQQGKQRRPNKVYEHYSRKIYRLRKKYDTLKGKGAGKEQLQEVQRTIKSIQRLRRRYPSGDPFDPGFRRLQYCRFADDFIIGIIGSYADAEAVREEVKGFIQETLKLTIAEEKSHIRGGKKGATFVGYWIKSYSGHRVVKVKVAGRHTTRKSVAERIQLHIPPGKLQQFSSNNRYGNYQTAKAAHKVKMTMLSDAEIMLAYNAELRGLANFYTLAHNVKTKMGKLQYLWRGSLFLTLAHKHKASMKQVGKRLKREDEHVLYVKEKDKTRVIRLFRLKDLKPPPVKDPQVDDQPNVFMWTLSRSELIRRLNAERCEYCGTGEGTFEVHHVRKLKDVAHGKEQWQQLMAARHRKTLILCKQCHQKLHAGTLPDRDYLQKKRKGRAGYLETRTSGSARG
jgi:group II intron reverse transcriptase/maturase